MTDIRYSGGFWMRYGAGKWHRYDRDTWGPVMRCGVRMPWDVVMLDVSRGDPLPEQCCKRCKARGGAQV